MVCVQWWCIGGWVGVVDSLRVGLHHRHGFVRAAKKENLFTYAIATTSTTKASSHIRHAHTAK